MEGRAFSYDARIVNPNNLFAGITLKLRKDCNGFIKYISEKESGWIYVTNKEVFIGDMKKYCSENNMTYGRGLQFRAVKNNGWIFDSYTYVPNSVIGGGYASYPLK